MKIVVIYATRSGNTKRVADAVAGVLGERGTVEIHSVDDAPRDLRDFDLVVIGGPTEAHGMTPLMKGYLDAIDAASVKDRPCAAFDTRLAWPRVLAGSAAEGIARWLREHDASVVASPESFIVSMKPELQPGELEHAHRWARAIAQQRQEAADGREGDSRAGR